MQNIHFDVIDVKTTLIKLIKMTMFESYILYKEALFTDQVNENGRYGLGIF